MGHARANAHRFAPSLPPKIERGFASVAETPAGPPKYPTFTQHLGLRTDSGMPMSGAREATLCGWLRPRVPLSSFGAPEVVALAMETSPRPIATLALTLQHFPIAKAPERDSHFFHRARAIAGQDGFIVEHRELWTAAGELVALNPQTFVWIR